MSEFERCVAKLDEINARLDKISGRSGSPFPSVAFIWFWMFVVPLIGFEIALIVAVYS